MMLRIKPSKQTRTAYPVNNITETAVLANPQIIDQPSNQDEEWATIMTVTYSMQEYARQGEWDMVIEMEKSRQEKLALFFDRSVRQHERPGIAEGIHELLNIDKEIMELSKANMNELSRQMRDMQTGKFIGADYAGGMLFGPDNLTNDWQFTAPNLTPDKDTGLIANWTEEMFITRMKAGRIYDYSPMPWAAFASMEEIELKAIYRYLRSLEPVNSKVEITAVSPENI